MAIQIDPPPSKVVEFNATWRTWFYYLYKRLTETIGTSEIEDGAVTTVKIATDAVTTAKIADNNVTAAKLVPGQFGGDYIKLSDTQTAGTTSGTFTSGAWRTRTLNTEDADTGSNCSLSSNQFTLDAGTYRILAMGMSNSVDRHKMKLRNTTDSSDEIIGINSFASATNAGSNSANVVGEFTIGASKVFEIQHYCLTTKATNGFGAITNFGVSEIYAVVELWKVK